MRIKRWLGMPNWFWIIFIGVLVLWVAGLYTGFFGGLIHILLLAALIMLIVWLAQRLTIRKANVKSK